MKTTVVNIKHDKYDVYIGRAGNGQDGYFGNPFIIGRNGNRDEVLDLYYIHFYDRLRTDPEFAARIAKLKGKVLGCFCKGIDKDDSLRPRCGDCVPCHGDIIADYLDIDPKVKSYVDKLLEKGFYTFSSCDGGDGHSFRRRTIKICVDKPIVNDRYGYKIVTRGERRCYERFIDLCDFVETQKWTYCKVLLVRNYVIGNDNKPEASVHFELVWN